MKGIQPPSVAESARKLQRSAKDLWASLRAMSIDDVLTGKRSKDDEESGTETEAPMALEKLESLARLMFGSCTTAMEVPSPVPPHYQHHEDSPSSKRNKSRTVPSSPHQEKSEVLFVPFMPDEHQEAEKVVSSLREKDVELRRTPHSPASPPKLESGLPRMFPASSPKQTKEIIFVPAVIQDNGPLREIASGPCLTFDDGISAISAHTLEEMVRLDEMAKSSNGAIVQKSSSGGKWELIINKSGESSLFPPSTPNHDTLLERKKPDAVPEEYPQHNVCANGSPASLSRSRSHSSRGTRSTRGTKSTFTKSTLTRSTQTTTSGEFEHKWRRDEQDYWNDVVAHEQRLESEKSIASRHMEALKKVREKRARSKSRDSVSWLSFMPSHANHLSPTPMFFGQASAALQDLKLNQNATITTVPSSEVYSSLAPSFGGKHHPHDTLLHFEPSDVIITSRYVCEPDPRFATLSHPDRISEMLVMPPDTEMAEI